MTGVEFDPKAFSEARQQDIANEVGAKSDGGTNAANEAANPPAPAGGESAPQAAPPAAGEFAYQLKLTAEHGSRFKELLDVEDESSLTADTLIEKLSAYKLREAELTNTLLEKSVFTSDKLTSLNGKKELDSEKLVRDDLKAQGFSDEEIEEQLEIYVSTGVIDKQKELIVKRIDREITAETESLRQKAKDDVEQRKLRATGAMTPEQKEAAIKLFKEQLKTDSIAGVAFGKTAEEVVTAKQAHAEYLASGQFEKDMKKNPATYAELGFIFKNWETVQKVLVSKGIETGKASVLEKLQAPSRPDNSRPPVPASGEGFDPKAWNSERQAQFKPN